MVSRRLRLVRGSARRRRPVAAPAPSPVQDHRKCGVTMHFRAHAAWWAHTFNDLEPCDPRPRDRPVPRTTPPPALGCSAMITAGPVPVAMATSQRATGKALPAEGPHPGPFRCREPATGSHSRGARHGAGSPGEAGRRHPIPGVTGTTSFVGPQRRNSDAVERSWTDWGRRGLAGPPIARFVAGSRASPTHHESGS